MIDRRIIDDAVRRLENDLRISGDLILGRDRRSDIAEARALLFWILRTMGFSCQSIGRSLGFDHTSVLYGSKMTVERMKTNKPLANIGHRVARSLERSFAAVEPGETEEQILADILKSAEVGEIVSQPWKERDLISLVVTAKAKAVAQSHDPRYHQTLSIPVRCKGRNFKVHFEAQVKNGFLGFQLIDFVEEGVLVA